MIIYFNKIWLFFFINKDQILKLQIQIQAQFKNYHQYNPNISLLIGFNVKIGLEYWIEITKPINNWIRLIIVKIDKL